MCDMNARQAALFCLHGGNGWRPRGSRAERAVIFQNMLVPLNCRKNCSTGGKKTDGGVKEEEEEKNGQDGRVEKKRNKRVRVNSDRLERSRQREDGGRFTFKRNWVLVGFANRSEHTDLIFLLTHIFPFISHRCKLTGI